MFVTEKVNSNFKKRLEYTIEMIKKYKVEYIEIGVFGSYAREEHKSTSDIDVCIIANEKPNRYISGELREEAELQRVDIVFVTKEYFENSIEPFAVQLRRDYRKI